MGHFPADPDTLTQGNLLVLIGHDGLVHAGKAAERGILILIRIRLFIGQIVTAQDDILGRYGNRLAVLGFQEVIGRQHEEAGFGLGLS